MTMEVYVKNQVTDSPNDTKVIWGVRAAIGLGAVGVLAALAPLIWSAVNAGAGLIVLVLLGVVGIGIFQALPWLGQKWENKLLAARKSEARANPIEQLQNFLRQKRERVAEFRKAVVQIGAQINSMRDMIAERKQKKPGYDAAKQERAVNAMNDAHVLLVKKYKDAEEALVQLQDVIEDKKFEWSFGQAGQAAIQSLNATSGQELLDQMLADEAFSSVRDNFNQVFAELEMEAAKLSSAKELSFDDGMTIDLSSIKLNVAEKVRV